MTQYTTEAHEHCRRTYWVWVEVLCDTIASQGRAFLPPLLAHALMDTALPLHPYPLIERDGMGPSIYLYADSGTDGLTDAVERLGFRASTLNTRIIRPLEIGDLLMGGNTWVV